MMGRTFKEAFCHRYRCPATEYEQRVFRYCLYRRAIPLAALLQQLQPGFFREEVELTQRLASDTGLEEIHASVRDYQFSNQRHRHWLRTGWRMRMSGRRVLAQAPK